MSEINFAIKTVSVEGEDAVITLATGKAETVVKRKIPREGLDYLLGLALAEIAPTAEVIPMMTRELWEIRLDTEKRVGDMMRDPNMLAYCMAFVQRDENGDIKYHNVYERRENNGGNLIAAIEFAKERLMKEWD